MVRELALTRGLVALVDEADFDRCAAHRWCARRSNQVAERYYAQRGGRPGEPGTVYLHRFILTAPTGQQVDHANGDGLDNRRANLRLCTRSQNNANCASFSKYGFRGIGYQPAKRRPWQARLQPRNQPQQHLGYFATAEEAARAWDVAALAAYGEFAKLNFPIQAREAS